MKEGGQIDSSPRKKLPSKSLALLGLKNIKLNALPVYDNRNTKTKIKTYGEFSQFNCARRWCRCKSFRIISIDFLLVYEKNIICKYI